MMIPKFRCWDKPNKIMRFNDEIVIWNDQVYINGKKELDSKIKGYSCLPEYLMQSTGLKEKNGVEIYEGDIVRHSEIATDISIVRFGEFGVPNIEEMEYQDTAVGFYFENASDLKDVEPFNMTVPINNEYAKDVTIIGNIYTNPELLEEK